MMKDNHKGTEMSTGETDVVLHPEEASETFFLNTQAIHPRRGAKFSPNLYRWLTNRDKKHRTWTSRVFRDRDGVMWIGMLDEGLYLLGCRLMQVLCEGSKAKSMAWSLANLGPLEEIQDFWERYTADGRCAIDTEHQMHFVGDDTRWHATEGTRECRWCGKARQQRERYTRTTERERWVQA